MRQVKIFILIVFVFFAFVGQNAIGQCYPGQIITAAYATNGSSPYLNNVLWLTWGSTNQTNYPYGRHAQDLSVGSKSFASINLGSGVYLCIEAEITSVTGKDILSYRPGAYVDDRLDDLYNIGGLGNNNQLIAGIRNKTSGVSTIGIRCKATINGNPVRLAGMVLADGESLAGQMDNQRYNWIFPNENYGEPLGEYIYATAHGDWSVVNVDRSARKGSSTYYIRKESNNDNTTTIKFLGGGDNRVSVSAFLKFNQNAYDTQSNGFAVNFTTELKGGGLTSLAIGLIATELDSGDAPESYGKPYHLIPSLSFTSDNIGVVSSTASTLIKGDASVNVNLDSYVSGTLIGTVGSYLGSVPPDIDIGNFASGQADGDDNNKPLNDEDAWPEALKKFSYKLYNAGGVLNAVIPYKNGKVGDKISGWIDFNLDGVFNESERQTANVTSNGNGNVTLIWSIPSNRKARSTYVRLRYFDESEDFTNASTSSNYGEIEDHKIYLLTPTQTNPTVPSKPKKL